MRRDASGAYWFRAEHLYQHGKTDLCTAMWADWFFANWGWVWID